MSAPFRIDITSLSPDDLAALREQLRCRPGQRSLETQKMVAQRDNLIRAAARTVYWPNSSAAEFARAFHRDLDRYHGGPWRRDRCCNACPAKYFGTATEILWRVLRTIEHVLSERRLRHIVGRELPPFGGHQHGAP